MKRSIGSSRIKTTNIEATEPLHPTQLEVYRTWAKYRVVVCGRRWGKSRLAQRIGLKAAMQGLPHPDGGRIRYDYSPESPPVVVFAMPTLAQCKKIFWEPIYNMLRDHPAVSNINKSDHRIEFHQNGQYYRPSILFMGLNDQDGDRARGLRIAHINIDEFQDVAPGVFDEVITPALEDTLGSSALLTGTPKGKANHLYAMYNRAELFEEWKSFHYITADNPIFTPERLEMARSVLSPRTYRQEYEASFEEFPGQIFESLSHDHLEPMWDTWGYAVLGVDWGDVNPALCVILRRRDNFKNVHWQVAETWWNDTGQTVSGDVHRGEAERLVKKYNVRMAYCGHDRPASTQAWHGAIGCPAYTASIAVAEGVQAIDGLLHHRYLTIADTETEFFNRLLSYHRPMDKNGHILEGIAADQDDHDIDACRYALYSAIAQAPPDIEFQGSGKRFVSSDLYKPKARLTPNNLRRMR